MIHHADPFEVARYLRLMAEEGAPNEALAKTEYWSGWNDAIGAHLGNLFDAAELLEALAKRCGLTPQEENSNG